MKYLISKNTAGELVGFSEPDINANFPESADLCTVFTADVLSSITLNADAADVYWLYEVCLSDTDTVYVTAFDYSDAIVTALIHRGVRTAPLYVREYDLYDLKKKGSAPPVEFEFDGQSLNALLGVLNEKNRDFVAHAIMYTGGESEEAIRNIEIENIRSVLRTGTKTGFDLSVTEILDVCSYIWNNYILFESTGALLDVHILHGTHKKEKDPVSLLFWTYVFEKWAHYECHLPYTLYRLLLDGGFDILFDRFWEERGILE